MINTSLQIDSYFCNDLVLIVTFCIFIESVTLFNQYQTHIISIHYSHVKKIINNDRFQTNQASTRRSVTQPRTVNKARDLREEQMETDLKLLKFLTDNQLTLTQVNGQRKLGPPPGWSGPPPGPKCEIFVGSIPRNYYEPDIVHIFSSVGTIYELRLMMEFSGTNRGYCFIMYTTEEEAARAVKELHHYEIYPGKRLGVVPSANNCRLCINRLPRNLDSKSIIKVGS
ncbi:hypothetical protein K0M31_019771 [Melipona bicolor]|uniref:RRM domain-containing protein n=1 Tax=Melipona bicolor TaxID=60889 RepID=A0AA40G326_9HYME|nr:hypothetical protein K0M31_019771 [Melipona bicolor]